MKKCAECGVEKPKKEFHKCKKNKDGYDYRCKNCKNEYTKKWSKNKRQSVAEQRALLPDQSEVPKFCFKCKKVKPTKDLSADNRSLDGTAGYCKDCKNKECVERLAKPINADRRKKRLKEKYDLDEEGDKQGKTYLGKQVISRKKKDPIGSRAKDMRRTMRYNARKKGFDFDSSYYTLEKIQEMIEAIDFCPCCSRKIDKAIYGDGEIRAAVPVPDRVNPKLGYIEGNVVLICRRCNWIKNDGTDDEFFRIIRWMKEFNQNGGLK